MSINVNEDVIGSGGFGGGGWGGGYGGVILIAIILVIIAIAFLGRRDGYDHYGPMLAGFGHGHHGKGCDDSCADKMTWSRFANFEDPAIAKVQTEIACTTGQIKTQNAVDTGAIIHALDQQTCEIKLGEAAIMQNQTKLAMEAERMFMGNQIAELREQKLELKGKLLQQETVNTINAGNSMINHRLDGIECNMAKRPPFYAAGGNPYINPFNFQPAPIPVVDGFRRDGFRDGNCCCA